MLEEMRAALIDASDLEGPDIDRLALALALAEMEGALPEGVERTPHCAGRLAVNLDLLDKPFGAPLLATLADGPDAGVLAARGLALLHATWEAQGSDWLLAVAALSPQGSATFSGPTPGAAIDVALAVDGEGQDLRWPLNVERGLQNNANARLAGRPGTGKTQLLLQLLAEVARRSATGFVLFDYKGDLSTNADFIRATNAKVIRPGEEPVPVNPFHIPSSVTPELVPEAFAEVFASAAQKPLGDVQRYRLSRAMKRVYQQVGQAPTLRQIHRAVEEAYNEERARPDSVLSLLERLVELRLFADRPEASPERVFSARWIVDLSKLRGAQEFVAFVLLEYLHNQACSLPDASFEDTTGCRQLRGIIAVDEAHYYLQRRCQPLLRIIRVGRSKGVPVFLSSQSIADFKDHT